MKKVAFLVAAAATFALGPLAARLGPIGGAALGLALAVAFALAASGHASSLATASGAMGALAGAVLSTVSPAAGGAVLAALAFAERTLRVRGRAARLAHLGAALVGGAIAGAVSASYAGASLAVRAVSVVVCAVLLALPLLVDADDPVAHALDAAAAHLPEPARASLREGAELRRTADEDLLDRASAQKVRRTWRALLQLAETRIRLERTRGLASRSAHAEAVVRRLDERLAEHVAILARAYTAADTARAAEASLDDRDLRSVETVGESMESVSRAIVEDV